MFDRRSLLLAGGVMLVANTVRAAAPSLRIAKTPSLEIAYAQIGRDDQEPVLLLHGWPYDPRSYDGMVPALGDSGFRVIVPYLRGFGETRYLNDGIFRSGEQSALGRDVVDLLDALKIGKALLVGYDWGGRAACVAAALWPERVRGVISVGGYTIFNSSIAQPIPADTGFMHARWYQWMLNTDVGAGVVERNRSLVAERLWREWSPKWKFDAATFKQSVASLQNPDWMRTTLNCYRTLFKTVPGDPALAGLEERLSKQLKISVPMISLQGDSDPLRSVEDSANQNHLFTAAFERRILPGVGHCPPMEAPDAVVATVKDLMAGTRG